MRRDDPRCHYPSAGGEAGRKSSRDAVLDRPEIPLHTNGSENDIRCHVTRRKVSGRHP